MNRTDLEFPSGDGRCAAWLYQPVGGGPGPCVVMAHGFSLTRHDGLPAYAVALAGAGASVLVFDHRHLGDSPGEPRQRFRKPLQREDWRAAVAAARALPGVDRIILWGFSFAGGHAVETAVADPSVAAVLTLCPFLDGLARVLSTPVPAAAWILPRALLDTFGRHNLVPVTGPPGSRAAMALPGEAEGFAAAVPPGSPWRNEISPGLFTTVAFHRPVARAARLRCPLWVGLCEADVSTSRRAVERLAARAPRGELATYPYDHFEPIYGDGPARVVSDQIAFLRRHGLLPG